MAIDRLNRRCRNCVAYAPLAQECRLNPAARAKGPFEWCMQWVSFDVQDHPGADPNDNWKVVGRIVPDDMQEETNPLGRTLATETTTTTTTTTT